jgi:hypothetical protein
MNYSSAYLAIDTRPISIDLNYLGIYYIVNIIV